MSWIPAFEIGVWNAWIFMIIYPLQWLAVVIVPKNIAERTSHPADFKQERRGRLMGMITSIFWIVATLYSIFLPLDIGKAWFYVGLGAFVIGLAVLVSATLSVILTPTGEPFTGGIYRFSRHPMYLSMIFVYMGVSIAAASWLFFLLTIVTYFLQRYQMIQEERYCCAKFGRSYSDYVVRTPRWIGTPRRSNQQ
jgi:protein-S-isoprenylcysteine O-methyltransferase Ste14